MNYNELLAQIEQIKTATTKNSNTATKVGSAMEGIAKMSGGVQIKTLDISAIIAKYQNGENELGESYSYDEQLFGMSADELLTMLNSQTLLFVTSDVKTGEYTIKCKFPSSSFAMQAGKFEQYGLDISSVGIYLDSEAMSAFLMFYKESNAVNYYILVE